MKSTVVNIDVNFSDLITPKSCSVLICALIKHLIYQREQIPYTYERLKYIITRRRELIATASNEEEEEDSKISRHSRIAAERHFSKAEETFLSLESAFKDIELELQEQSTNAIDEVLIIFGNTPVHPQNIFRIQVPHLAVGHKEENHPTKKHLPSLFQALISSEELHKVFSRKMSPTNVFILLKTKESSILKSEAFHQKESYRVPVRTAHIKFLLKTEKTQQNCTCDCSDLGFPVFCDTPSRHSNVVENVIYSQPVNTKGRISTDVSLSTNNDSCENEDNSDDDDDCSWFQFSQSIKGFKDCKIDGMSATNIWLKCTKHYD